MHVARREVRVPSVRQRIEASQADAAAVYLTNEVFLYRVVGLAGNGADEVVELEDCYGLDIVTVAATDLYARRLRVVTPARDVTPREATQPGGAVGAARAQHAVEPERLARDDQLAARGPRATR